MDWNQFWAVGLIALILGLIGGAFLFGGTEIVFVDRDVPGETIYEEVEVEVEVEVPGETIYEDRDYLGEALSEFLLAAEDEEDEAGNPVKVLECGEDNFDFDELSVSRVYDDWSISFDDDGDERTVEFEVKVKYKEQDERSCRNTFDVEVHWEDDEDTEVVAVLQES